MKQQNAANFPIKKRKKTKTKQKSKKEKKSKEFLKISTTLQEQDTQLYTTSAAKGARKTLRKQERRYTKRAEKVASFKDLRGVE